MKRFFVRRFYRRLDRGNLWYARVSDLRTGRKFRMSSGEKNLKKANDSLRLRLRVISQAEEEKPNAEGQERAERMARYAEEFSSSPPCP